MSQELHCFALAVAQAGAFIHCHSSLSEYRELYQHERDNLLRNEETQGHDSYTLAVYSTWRLSYDKLDPSARLLIQICSLLHHEGVSEEMFKKAALSQLDLEDSKLQNEVTKVLNQLGKQDSGWSSWTFQKVIMRLRAHSLIEYDHQNRTYSIHPLVHHWSGTTMEGNQQDMQKLILTIIGLSFSLTFTNEDYKYRRTLLKHTTNSMDSLKPEDINPLVGTHLAHIYGESGRLKEMEALEVMVMEKKKRVLGDHHPDTLKSMEYLAGTYLYQGRWSDAEALYLVVFQKTKLVLGEDHHNTLTSMGNLATAYRKRGRWNEAETLQLAVLEKRKLVLGGDNLDTITSMECIAGTYWKQGRLKDAEALQMEVVEKRTRILGADHPLTFTSMDNLASIYRDQGRLDDAEALGLVVLEKCKQLLGDDHPYTLRTMSNLAVTYWKQGRWNDAEVLQLATMEKTKRVLGDDHEWTLENMANLANTYRDHGRLKEAEALGVETIEQMKRVLGDCHHRTLTTMEELAATYKGLSRWNDAKALEEVVEGNRKRHEDS